MCNASNGSDVLARAGLEAGTVNRRDARGELVGHQGSVSNCVRTFESNILHRVPPSAVQQPTLLNTSPADTLRPESS